MTRAHGRGACRRTPDGIRCIVLVLDQPRRRFVARLLQETIIRTTSTLRRHRALAAAAIMAGIASATAVHAQVGLDALATQTPDAMHFVADPAHAGYETAVLVGNPAGPGVYAVRTKLPAGITIMPHTHGEKWRIATVLAGTLYYAQGDTFDAAKLKALGPGSLIVEPRGIPHFALTRGEAVMLHIVGEGPASTDPVRK